jgi:hypothetical protein
MALYQAQMTIGCGSVPSAPKQRCCPKQRVQQTNRQTVYLVPINTNKKMPRATAPTRGHPTLLGAKSWGKDNQAEPGSTRLFLSFSAMYVAPTPNARIILQKKLGSLGLMSQCKQPQHQGCQTVRTPDSGVKGKMSL